MMFNPTRDQSRQFLFDLWEKQRAGAALSPLESLALSIVLEHPEYHAMLEDRERYLERDWRPEGGETNPFLHLAMHLSISEQCSIDQPSGIRQAIELLAARKQSLHEAHHAAMDCLGEMIWKSQRSGLPPDGHQYLDCVRRRATQDSL